jgi:hypothetical protein
MSYKPIVFLYLILYAYTADPKVHSESHTSMVSSSYVSSYEDDSSGKPVERVRSMKTEEHRDKLNDNPEKIRKYGEFVKIDEDGNHPENNQAILRQKAATNVDTERLFGNGDTITELDEAGKRVSLFINM